ncbi:MAG: lipid-binding SYLF domain-containing protein [Nitrospira sp.]|nr:lipid-binding SYLF domain-containing protein [Nitrospira sp.]MDD9860112.1 lipid-binding SYLF domain-containing protein [Nitrospira sp.]
MTYAPRLVPHSRALRLVWWSALLLCLGLVTTPASASEERQLVEKSQHTFESFMEDPNLTWFQNHINDAKAILIVPQRLRAAFFVGADGGSGIALARDEQTGEWSQPAFYVLGGLSLGLQWGGDASEVILLAMTHEALENLYTSSFKLGGDASIATGPYGGGIQGSTSANVNAAFLAFSRSKGAYVGISLEGAILYASDDSNAAYYGEPVRPVDILVKGTVTNDHSANLRKIIQAATTP